MVWKSWGGGALLLLLPAIAALLLAAAPPLCSAADDDVAVSFSAAPRRVSRSPSAAFAFRVTLTGAGGAPCGDCTVTCQVSRGSLFIPLPPSCAHARIRPSPNAAYACHAATFASSTCLVMAMGVVPGTW